MFEFGGGVGAAAGDVALDALRFVELSGLARIENAHAARKVLLAGELTLSALERDVALRGGDIRDCGNEAIAEVSTRLGCSHTMGSHFCDLGVDLRLRLPLTCAAFLAGDLDYARAWRIHRETAGLSPETLALLEGEIVRSALRLAPAALGREIRELIVRASPDEAASDREVAEAECRVRVRPVGPLSEFTAILTAEQGQAAWQLVCEMADTVCKKDRRGRQILLVDAFVALLTVNPRCPARARSPTVPRWPRPRCRRGGSRWYRSPSTSPHCWGSPPRPRTSTDTDRSIRPSRARSPRTPPGGRCSPRWSIWQPNSEWSPPNEISPQLVPSPSPSPSPSPMPMPGTGAGPTTRHLTSRRGGRGCTCSGPAAPGAAVVVCRAGRRDRVRGPGRHRVASAGRSRRSAGHSTQIV
ncbi:DUF222 domain-containing protein [Rhodococcus hoagii]|uniref:DUF222 domain-containing protein n=1 Tax=Rhodococcus hoagii TaxID=43767 RepID=A0A9Q5F0J2_RHOHA|nr:DUF222 domain-containing protein [Prescottella equi]MBM4491873.1 DUF222 domain-containing protein [Prescottella equi]MBM4497925.1 DUF222 domain-containing protein [Prescottella equi]MBM4506666.1 DUF222 domain-containing protein [Prescottella equi]MBM4513854.1 DUF222 domain-containing protein [Prescottella equi]